MNPRASAKSSARASSTSSAKSSASLATSTTAATAATAKPPLRPASATSSSIVSNAQIQPSAAPTSTKTENQQKLVSISLAHPASYVCMYGTCTQVSRTADSRSRSNHENQPSHINVSEFATTYDGALRLVIARCDSVLIQDCDLSQRETISLRYSMPRPTYSIFKQEEGNSNGANLRVGLVNWGAKSS